MSLIGTILQLGGEVYKGVRGYKQRKEANKINPIRPDYAPPEAINDQVDLYRGLANQALLPQQTLMEDKYDQATSSGINAIQSAGGSSQDIIAGASKLVGGQTRTLNDLAIAGANQQRQAQQLYGNSLGALAGYQDQEFMLNKLQPFYDDVARKQALLASGDANIYGALNNGGNIVNEYGNQQDQKKMQLLSMLGGGAG